MGDDYERLFSCTLYPKEYKDPDNLLQEWTDEHNRCLNEIIDEFDHEFDVSYGPEKVDIWYPKNKASNQVHLFVHGGYWICFTKRTYCSVLRSLLQAGFIVVMVGYTYASKIPLNEVVKEVEKAILFSSNKFPNAKLTISGHSAGGHLISKALENPQIQEVVKAAVVITAVYEVLPLMGTTIATELKLTEELGKNMNVDASKLAKFPGNILIIDVEYDAPKLKEQSADFFKKLSKLKDNVQVKCFDEDHFTVVSKLHDPESDVSKNVLNFLLE